MKMRPTVNSDDSVNTNRSPYVAWYNDHSSRRPKEQISASKNAQTEYETHLSQNAAYSSTYGSGTTPPDQHTANREWRVDNPKEDQRNIKRNSEETEQTHKSVDTRDINLPRRHRSKSCVKLRLWCLRLCRAKKRCSQHVLRKPRQFLERIKTRSKEKCEKPDDVVAVAGVSTMPHRESIRYRDVPKKSRRTRKQDEMVEIADKDVSEDIVKKERKERKKREKEERRKKVMTDEEKRRKVITEEERKVSHKLDEHVPQPVDTRLVTHDDDLVVEERVPMKPPSIVDDFAKSCCYLCAQNTLAIAAAAAISKPEQSDKCVQVSAHKFHVETSPALDKSCSPLLLVRTVQSSVKVRTWETSTLCAGTSAVPRAKKHKKFAMFPGLTRTKCPAGRHAACETDKSTARRDDNAEKRQPRNERCCGKKNA
ncbi:DNA ligase 1 [Mycetomoellerius zeteki]|uniref:DNA ligase 1 n=1 Tax=Mycetomoellerius zeteki TaxID=64791 RepID=UPI00084EBCB6|nr:PREDICTED: DNA ligase 1-like [Trachymyrmex zeteki]